MILSTSGAYSLLIQFYKNNYFFIIGCGYFCLRCEVTHGESMASRSKPKRKIPSGQLNLFGEREEEPTKCHCAA